MVGGTHLTNSFPVTDVSSPADAFGNPANRVLITSGPRSFILGASLEGKLNESFSIEANVLHRPLKWRFSFTEFQPDGPSFNVTETRTPVRTWQFPVLVKYSFDPVRIGEARPFLTAGPSFRTQEDAGAVQPSQFGFTVGAGFTLPLGRFRIAPTLRYTRWQRESVSPRFDTRPDQLEMLASFAYETESSTRRFAGRKLEVGGLLGLPLTRSFEPLASDGVFRERFEYLAGLTAQVDIVPRLTLEIDAIYKPLRAVDELLGSEHPFTVLTWQFPVLAKYQLREAQWAPFVTGGPSFRLSGNLNGYDPSHVGGTVGVGIEKRVGSARWTSSLRYTRWAADSGRLRTNPNALEGVIGVTF